MLVVNVRAGYLFARQVPRVGDRDFLARDEDADLALLAPKDRLPAGDRDDHAADVDVGIHCLASVLVIACPKSETRGGGRARSRR